MTKIMFISDLHGGYLNLDIKWDGEKSYPEADIVVCAGDMTCRGKENEVVEFLEWFKNLKYNHKLFIAGNHDFLFENYRVYAKELIPEGIIYLEDSGVEIMGINFWGSPVQPVFHNWAFNRTEEQLIEYWKMIPENTDVLITHSPPKGIMDISKRGNVSTGSPSLFNEVLYRIKPKIHVFGHIHEGYGIEERDGIKFINASNMNMYYDLVNPIIIEEI